MFNFGIGEILLMVVTLAMPVGIVALGVALGLRRGAAAGRPSFTGRIETITTTGIRSQ